MLDRAPPQNPEAELSLIGCILIELSTLDRLIGRVTAEDLFDERCAIAFRELAAIHAAGKRYDPIVFRERIGSRWVGMGGEEFIRQAIAAVGYSGHATHYADIVREKAILRSLIRSGTEMLRRAYQEGDALEDLEAAERSLHAIRRHVSGGSCVQLRERVHRVVEQIQEEARRRQSLGITIGIRDADQVLGSARGGELIVLGARPGMGKTTLAFQWARFVARSAGPVLFASLEMSEDELIRRALCGQAGVDTASVRRGLASEYDIQGLRETAPRFNEPVAIWSRRRITVAGLASLARKQQATEGLRAVFVDYIGRVMPENLRLPRHEQIAQISGDLKWLAQELDVPVVVLCQLKREDDAVPTLSSLRESGAIEQDADAVLFLFSEPPKKGEPKPGPDDDRFVELIVAKNRHGSIGKTTICWNPAAGTFSQTADGGFGR